MRGIGMALQAWEVHWSIDCPFLEPSVPSLGAEAGRCYVVWGHGDSRVGEGFCWGL